MMKVWCELYIQQPQETERWKMYRNIMVTMKTGKTRLQNRNVARYTLLDKQHADVQIRQTSLLQGSLAVYTNDKQTTCKSVVGSKSNSHHTCSNNYHSLNAFLAMLRQRHFHLVIPSVCVRRSRQASILSAHLQYIYWWLIRTESAITISMWTCTVPNQKSCLPGNSLETKTYLLNGLR